MDSHVFLWLADSRRTLRPAAMQAIEDATAIFLSTASVAELCIKSNLGKLQLPPAVEHDPLDGFVVIMNLMGVEPLPVGLAHAVELQSLPRHHGDPFDRLIIAQARLEGLTVVTNDRAFALYEGLDIVWT
jgi:PIN domain nuclease of toxin-antitoxin system